MYDINIYLWRFHNDPSKALVKESGINDFFFKKKKKKRVSRLIHL